MPQANAYADILRAIDLMGYRYRTRSDGSTLRYLELLTERPVMLEELDVPAGPLVNSIRHWLQFHNLRYTVIVQNSEYLTLQKSANENRRSYKKRLTA